jgi:hypothetical protein
MNGKSILNFNSARSILKGRIPGQLVIQYTDFCNAECPSAACEKQKHMNVISCLKKKL